MLNTSRSRPLVAAAVLAAAATVAAGPKNTVPLTITIANATTTGLLGAGGAYVNGSEGRVPVAVLDGNIALDLRGSTRTACFVFDTIMTPGPAESLKPRDVCAPVLLRTLTRTDGVPTVSGLAVGETQDFGMDVYWTGPAESGGTFDYVLEYKRAAGNGVNVSHPDANTWTLENVLYAQVSVYRTGVGKGGGWSVVGTYDMPVNLTAVK